MCEQKLNSQSNLLEKMDNIIASSRHVVDVQRIGPRDECGEVDARFFEAW